MEFERYKAKFEEFLSTTIERWDFPSPLKESMTYSLKSGGKRYRPTLMLIAYEKFGGEICDSVLNFALAIECLHTYSLVHDDLPCMDNDDFRRGNPTNHKVFGETTAVLCGDALLNYAYELVFKAIKQSGFDKKFVLAGDIFSARTGANGMIKGQVLDLNFGGEKQNYFEVTKHKTADLMSASITIGAMLAGASEEEIALIDEFAYDFGFAFQIIDDILDKDKDEDCTILRFENEESAKILAITYIENGLKCLDKIEKDLDFFREFSLVAFRRIN